MIFLVEFQFVFLLYTVKKGGFFVLNGKPV